MAKWQNKQTVQQKTAMGTVTHDVYPCTGHPGIAGIVFSSFGNETHLNVLVIPAVPDSDPALDPAIQHISGLVQKRIGIGDCTMRGYAGTLQVGIHFTVNASENTQDQEEIINAVDALVLIPDEMKYALAEQFCLDKVALDVAGLYHRPTPLEKALEAVLTLHESTAAKSPPGVVVREVLTNQKSRLAELLGDIISQVNNGTLKLSYTNTQRLAALSEAVAAQKTLPSGLSTAKQAAIENVAAALERVHYQHHFGADETQAAQGPLKDNIRSGRIQREVEKVLDSVPYTPETETDAQTIGKAYSHAERVLREKERQENRQKGALL